MIPKTIEHPDFLTTLNGEPFYIKQCNYPSAVHFYSFYDRWYADSPNDYAVAVFKVTPKTK